MSRAIFRTLAEQTGARIVHVRLNMLHPSSRECNTTVAYTTVVVVQYTPVV